MTATWHGADDASFTPFLDVRFSASAHERRTLLLRLHELGIVSLCLAHPLSVGLSVVSKKNGTQRSIVDARQANKALP